MDDVIPVSESQSLMMQQDASNHYPPKVDEAKGGDRANGSLNNLKIPNLSSEAAEEGEDKENEDKGGGILTSFITLVSPKSTNTTPKSGEVTKRRLEAEVVEVEAGEMVNGETEQGVGSGENGGGVISNLISNFFHPSEEDKEPEKVEDAGNKRLKMDEEEAAGGGIIDNIVSHLPTSLPDDAAPTTDEATILLHSVVKD